MKYSYPLFIFFLFFSPLSIKAQIQLPDWPEENGYFQYSDYYEVWVRQGSESDFLPVETLMSTSQDELIPFFPNGIYQNRTFSYAPFYFDPGEGALTIQVRKKGISGSITNLEDVEILNVRGEVLDGKTIIDENTIQFELTAPRYTSVYFKVSQNLKTSDLHETIKHMLMIFPDPINEDLEEPEGPNKLVYDPEVTTQQIRQASLIIFRPGYHNIRERWGIDGMGITSGTTVWLAPGAVVDGTILAVDNQGNNNRIDNCLIYGRGILYNGNHRNPVNDPENGPYWHFNANSAKKQTWNDAIDLRGNNNEVRGLIIADIYHHGIVSGNNSQIERVKIWGWHYNCDGMRPGGGSIVRDCFVRPTDDAFYAFQITVQNTLIWQSFNGAVITCGWPGAYSTGGIVMTDCTVLYPEWRGRGNNNGIVASQLGSNQECTSVTINNLKIFGDPIALLNLKPTSSNEHPTGTNARNGGVRNIILSNVEVFGRQKEPSRLESDGNYNVKNVRLFNVKIHGFADRFLTNEDRSNPELFTGNNLTDDAYLLITASITSSAHDYFKTLPEVKIFPNPVKNHLFLEGVNPKDKIEILDLGGRPLFQTTGRTQIDLSNLSAGTYILHVHGYQPRLINKL